MHGVSIHKVGELVKALGPNRLSKSDVSRICGDRQILGIDVGASEDRAFWMAFFRSLVERGLRGVRLVSSDAAEGPEAGARDRAERGGLATLPRPLALLGDAPEDILAHNRFPEEYRRQLHSLDPLEPINKEIQRLANVVGIFPNGRAVRLPVGAILLEPDDETGRGRAALLQCRVPDTPEGAVGAGDRARPADGDCAIRWGSRTQERGDRIPTA